MRHFGIEIQKNFWGGAQSPPQTPPRWGGGHPLPKPHLPRRLRRLDLAPPFTNPGSALVYGQCRLVTVVARSRLFAVTIPNFVSHELYTVQPNEVSTV